MPGRVGLMAGKLIMHSRLLLAVLLAGAAVSCQDAQQATGSNRLAGNAEASNPSPGAVTAKPAAEDITSSGPIVVENQLDVAAQREGMVAEILADTGKSVRKGNLLAKLDDRQLAADRDAAEAKLRSIDANVKNWEAEIKVLEADRDRSEKMWAAQIITKEQLDHDRFKVEADRYELERERQMAINQQDVIRSLNLEVEKTRILAPFDGIVARRYVRVGQRVTNGDRLFWVTATSPLRVKFTLPQHFVGLVKRGQSIMVTSSDDADSQHTAKVIQVSPVVDPSSGTIEVLAEIVGAGGNLRPGMTANIRIPQPR
jgi:membrane fusion protein (multidrug efflux system)